MRCLSRMRRTPRGSRLARGVLLTAAICCTAFLKFAPACAADAAAPQSKPTPARSISKMTISQTPFGKTPDGEAAALWTITNAQGLVLKLTNYGARVVALDVPDRAGKLANVNFGFDSLEKYLAHGAFFGCTTGRYANRIARGQFELNGTRYKLATNNGENHLHGGVKGIDKQVWKGVDATTPDSAGVRFTLTSPDGDEGYPGRLDMTVTYSLTNNNELKIEYEAKTDKPTVINLTNHCYWNLAGAGSGDILNHNLTLFADKFIPVDAGGIPTGAIEKVQGTVMDFTEPHAIGSRIAETKKGPPPGGYDHCYVLRGQSGQLALAARVEEPGSGRVMEVYTTEPGIQFYTGNFLDGDPKNGGYKQHAAFCLETQHYPDSPNQPQFPSTVLKPGQTYKQVTVHRFSTK